VGQGQGVFVSKHSKAIQKRRNHPMSTIATTNETSNVTSLPSTSKAQTAKEVIAANVKLLIEQLEAGHSEGPRTSPQWAVSTTTASGTFSKSHDRSQTQPALQGCMRGTS
jgi:hypothetical protein